MTFTLPNILDPEEAFLGLEAKDAASYADARVVVVPFGLEETVSYSGGTSAGPKAMIEASHQVELFDEDLWKEPFRDWGVVTLAEPNLAGNSIAQSLELVEGIVSKLLDDGKFPFVFGGEHSVTPGAIRPYLRKFDDLIVLHFDAHADLRDGYEGEHYSHAAAIRRVMDNPNIEVVSFGIRNISASEIPFLEANKHRLDIHWAKDIKSWNVEAALKKFTGRPIYLTFDIDGLDSAVMPATGTPEPGGMLWNDVIPIIKRAAQLGTIVGADIVELAPIDGFHASNFLAAKLAYKIMSYSLAHGSN